MPPKRKHIEADDLFDAFERGLTFESFRTLCDYLNAHPGIGQVRDSLVDYAHKVPVGELAKMLEFIDGQPSAYCEDIELHIGSIVESHHHAKSWRSMSGERLRCLGPYLGEDFWEDLSNFGLTRDPSGIWVEELQGILSALLK